MESFKKTTNAFNFVYERVLKAHETVIVKMPPVSANKRGVNDIGWLTDGDVTLFGTIAARPERENLLWQEIAENDEVNKTVSAIKIVNNGPSCRICIRALFN